MELFKLFGTIAVDNAEANRSIDDTGDKAKSAGKDLGELADEGEKSESKLGKALSKMASVAAAVGKAIGVGLAVAGAAVIKIGKDAIASYADYEQLVGGVETLFKGSADTVIKNAANAYKTAGMSANEYMETVTGFSASLLQSVGNDTVAAAEKADMAITDMADNANKMGTSMETIQNAYQGFAKQNYTMLDNLKLGYGGTKEEMERLLADAEKISGIKYDVSSYADIVDAIHVVQTEMGITGTTALEASTTIQGSLSSMKGAWQNLLTGLTDESQDFDALINNLFDSIVTVGDNLIPRISVVLDGIANLMTTLAPKIMEKIPEILSTLLPAVINGATALLNSLVGILPQLSGMLMDILPDLIDAVIEVFIALTDALITSLPVVLPALIDGIIQLVVGIVQALPRIMQTLIEKLPEIIINIVDALMNNLPILIDGCVQLAIGIVRALPQIMLALIEALPTVLQSIIDGLLQALPQFITGIVQILGEVGNAMWTYYSTLFNMVWDGIKAIFAPVGDFFGRLWEGIKAIFQPVIDFFKGIFEGVVNIFHMVVDPWIEIVKRAFEGIKNFISDIWNSISEAFSAAWEAIKTVFAPVTDFFAGIWSGIQNAFSKVTDWFKNIFSNAWNAVKNVFSTGGKIFDGIKDGIANVFKTVVNGIINGINKVISVPFNAINKMLAKIRDISILGVSPFSWIKTFNVPQIPTMATGGVLKKGQTGYLEGDGDEAVVPLEKNTGWIKTVAEKINEFSLEAKTDLEGIIPAQSLEVQHQQTSAMYQLNEKVDRLLDILAEYFPGFAENMNHSIVLDDGTLVAKLTPKIDRELGLILKRKER
ncbi:MAG: hypothetical protein M0R40_06790 [Firmicutes bacterium]|nr:hypothetical protein [Bacillota bacterium]